MAMLSWTLKFEQRGASKSSTEMEDFIGEERVELELC